MSTQDRTRASDTERERVVGILRQATTDGRITVEELDQRCERAYAAVTRGELSALLEDLPVPMVPRPAPAPAAPPVPAPRPPASFSPPQYMPRRPPWESPWPGPRPWLPGVQVFHVRWVGPADARRAGEKVLEHVVPLFTDEGYGITARSADRLVLRRGEPSPWSEVAALAGLASEREEATIQMTAHLDHTVTDVFGAASWRVREALAALS